MTTPFDVNHDKMSFFFDEFVGICICIFSLPSGTGHFPTQLPSLVRDHRLAPFMKIVAVHFVVVVTTIFLGQKT